MTPQTRQRRFPASENFRPPPPHQPGTGIRSGTHPSAGPPTRRRSPTGRTRPLGLRVPWSSPGPQPTRAPHLGDFDPTQANPALGRNHPVPLESVRLLGRLKKNSSAVNRYLKSTYIPPHRLLDTTGTLVAITSIRRTHNGSTRAANRKVVGTPCPENDASDRRLPANGAKRPAAKQEERSEFVRRGAER